MAITISEANGPFARGVQKIISQKGLKQIYVAEKVGYSKQEFTDMLNGRKLIEACDIPRIAEVLGVTSSDIYVGDKKLQIRNEK